MKEKLLREMIRKQIKLSLSEAAPKAAVDTSLGKVEKLAGVKMLKNALGQGTPKQQAAGLYKVVQAISGDNPSIANELSKMIRSGGIAMDEPEAEMPTEENYTAGIDDGDAGTSLQEADDFEMSKIKGGLAKSKLGSQVEIDRAGVVLKNIQGLKDTDRAKALAYILSNAGFDKSSLMKLLQNTKTQLAKYSK